MARWYKTQSGKTHLAFRSAGDGLHNDINLANVALVCHGPRGGIKLATNITIDELRSLHLCIGEIIDD